jgi:hypothetical protein
VAASSGEKKQSTKNKRSNYHEPLIIVASLNLPMGAFGDF